MYIVCTYQYRKYIGLQGYGIFFPPLLKVGKRIAADAPVEELVSLAGIFALIIRGTQIHIPASVDVVHVPQVPPGGRHRTSVAISPIPVGNRIADKQISEALAHTWGKGKPAKAGKSIFVSYPIRLKSRKSNDSPVSRKTSITSYNISYPI